MPDWVREHIAEIALVIYLVYPLLKRWWERRKQRKARAEQQAEARRDPRAPAEERTATRRPQRSAKKRPARVEPAQPAATPKEARRSESKGPSKADFLEAARARVTRLQAETAKLLERTQRDARLTRLAPALREDLKARLDAVERSLGGSPSLSTIVQDTTVVAGLEQLLRYLQAMARQRTMGRTAFLSDADAIADACYAPILELARVQGLNLRTNQPVAVTGDWGPSILPRFASTRIAPLRLPVDFEHDVWRWPAIAHEVAHDFYYSLDSIDEGLRERLGLPRQVPVVQSEQELDGAWLRKLFGAWLPQVFADTLGTIMLGPAYVDAMVRAFRTPGSPQRTAAILQDGGVIDTHPPERLRVYIATRSLHHLGHHDEADALWDRWEADHPDVAFYYLPLGGDWVGLSEENLHAVADSVTDTLLQQPWPELDGFQLLNVPGLAYLHAEHARVERLMDTLADGETVDEDPRWITAAAVLSATAQPTLHDRILEAARKSIRGVTEEPAPPSERAAPHRAAESIGAELVASLRRPRSIRDAVILGAVMTPTLRR